MRSGTELNQFLRMFLIYYLIVYMPKQCLTFSVLKSCSQKMIDMADKVSKNKTLSTDFIKNIQKRKRHVIFERTNTHVDILFNCCRYCHFELFRI